MIELFQLILVIIMFIFIVCYQFSSSFIKFYVLLFSVIVISSIINFLIKLRNK